MASKRLHKENNLKLKYEALLELEKGKTNEEVSKIFDIPPNTLSTWKKNKDKIFDAFRQGNLTKRVKLDTYYQVNKAVLKWFKRMRADNVPINGLLVKEKALYFAKELSFENFQASDGWLDKFKKKYGISFKTISGEAKSDNDQMIAPWLETTLSTILSRYPLENFFNADEFSIFYQCLPDKSLHFKNEKSIGGKHSKVRLTGMAAGNVKGERLSMFVIGKSKSPRCFKGISLEAVEKHVNDENDPFCGLDVDETVMENLRDDLELLKTKFNADFNLTADELVDIDLDACIADKLSDEDIIAEVSEHDAIETEEESDDKCVGISDNATKPSLNEAMHAVNVLENYSLYSNFGDDLTKALKDINRVIEMDLKASKRQSTFTDFF
ncbi:tigger transposable element-derived protein 4-like [Hydra vulgaris]|uniref:Tigger transposable element-derived protein 4-like n=1 Tax=Hydra vulgaris TaxID=6087 RepID=A0ABM4C8V1_HYDVU